MWLEKEEIFPLRQFNEEEEEEEVFSLRHFNEEVVVVEENEEEYVYFFLSQTHQPVFTSTRVVPGSSPQPHSTNA